MNFQRLPLLREYVKSEILAGLVIIILRMGVSFWIRGGIVSHGSSRAERWGHLVGTETLRHWVVGEEQWYAEKADREGNKLIHYREGYKLIQRRMTKVLLCVRFNMKLFRCAVQQKPEKACREGKK